MTCPTTQGIYWATLYAYMLSLPTRSPEQMRARYDVNSIRPARMGRALNQARDLGLICGLLELTPAGRRYLQAPLSYSPSFRSKPIVSTLSNTYFDITDLLERLLEDASNLTAEKVAELQQLHAEITRLDQGGAPTQYSQEALATGLRYARYQTADGKPHPIEVTTEELENAWEYLHKLAFGSTICAAHPGVERLISNLVSGVLPRNAHELKLLLELRVTHSRLGTNLESSTPPN